MKRLALLVPFLPFVVGFKFIQPPRAFSSNDLPVEYRVGDQRAPGLSDEEKLDLVQRSFDNWRDVRCSPLSAEYDGEVNNDGVSGFGSNNETILTFDHDGRDDLQAGPLAATVTHASGEVVSHSGQNFFRTTAMNIIYNEGLTWGTPEDTASPDCAGAFDFLGVTTHEIGHGFGLGHSCDDGETCDDAILRSATMYWSVSSCNGSQAEPNEDDTAGINAIYGINIDFDVEAEDGSLVGPAPLTATVSVPDDFEELFPSVTSWEWNFGDGSERVILEGPDPVSHTWEQPGQYTISLTARGTNEECGGEFSVTQRKVGVALACGEPTPAFTWENLGDRTVALDNRTPLGTFGCVSAFTWSADGQSTVDAYEPIWSWSDEGTYAVTLTAAGPGGTSSETLEVEVKANAGEGCAANHAAAVGHGLGALLLLVPGLRRRLRRCVR